MYAWALECDFDTATFRRGQFSIEWPPRSGRQQDFAEVDRVEWFSMDEARRKINKVQIAPISSVSVGRSPH